MDHISAEIFHLRSGEERREDVMVKWSVPEIDLLSILMLSCQSFIFRFMSFLPYIIRTKLSVSRAAFPFRLIPFSYHRNVTYDVRVLLQQLCVNLSSVSCRHRSCYTTSEPCDVRALVHRTESQGIETQSDAIFPPKCALWACMSEAFRFCCNNAEDQAK